MKSILHIILLWLFIQSGVFSQNSSIVQNYFPEKDTVFHAGTIVHYGLDFSRFALTDKRKVGQDQKLRKFIPKWIKSLQKDINPERYITPLHRHGNNFEPEPIEVQDRNKSGQDIWINSESYSINFDTLQNTISSYHLTKNKGIGFVINVENFNKPGDYITCYFTFFDIASRKILWTTKVRSKPGGYGMNEYWANGIRTAFKFFINDVYALSVGDY
jgi:hypothetical protein